MAISIEKREKDNMSTTVQSIDRAFEILEALGNRPEGMLVKDLSATLGLNKSTVSRILATLAEHGYVAKNKNNYYRLGMRMVDLCSLYLNSLQLKTEALPFLEELRNQTGLIVHLGTMSENEVVYLEKISSFNNIRMYSQIGKRAYMHNTGLGKVMLSCLREKDVEEIIKDKGMPAVTEKTCTDINELLKELAVIRSRGYAIDEQENEMGIRCVAAPIYDYRGNVIAAVSATGFLDMFPEERIEMVAGCVKRCATNISRSMGHR